MGQRLPGGEDDGASGTELVLDGIGDVLGFTRGRGDDEDATPLGGIRGDRTDKRGADLRDRGDVGAIHSAEGTLDRLGDARDAAECPREARERHAPAARSIAARNCSAKSGRPTSRSVT